jgi:hypothetical protein
MEHGDTLAPVVEAVPPRVVTWKPFKDKDFMVRVTELLNGRLVVEMWQKGDFLDWEYRII